MKSFTEKNVSFSECNYFKVSFLQFAYIIGITNTFPCFQTLHLCLTWRKCHSLRGG